MFLLLHLEVEQVLQIKMLGRFWWMCLFPDQEARSDIRNRHAGLFLLDVFASRYRGKYTQEIIGYPSDCSCRSRRRRNLQLHCCTLCRLIRYSSRSITILHQTNLDSERQYVATPFLGESFSSSIFTRLSLFKNSLISYYTSVPWGVFALAICFWLFWNVWLSLLFQLWIVGDVLPHSGLWIFHLHNEKGSLPRRARSHLFTSAAASFEASSLLNESHLTRGRILSLVRLSLRILAFHVQSNPPGHQETLADLFVPPDICRS